MAERESMELVRNISIVVALVLTVGGVFYRGISKLVQEVRKKTQAEMETKTALNEQIRTNVIVNQTLDKLNAKVDSHLIEAIDLKLQVGYNTQDIQAIKEDIREIKEVCNFRHIKKEV